MSSTATVIGLESAEARPTRGSWDPELVEVVRITAVARLDPVARVGLRVGN